METVRAIRTFRAVYDPANYVFCGYDPWKGWQLTKEWTVHFHIKDWVKGETHGRVAGEGQGRIPEVMADAVRPELRRLRHPGAAPAGRRPDRRRHGRELFPKAVAAFRGILDQVGARLSD